MGIEFVVGTHTKVELISGSHGAVRVPLAQTFDYTPSYDEKRIYEFDSPGIVAVVTNFNGVEVRFDHFDSDSKLVDAALNDLDPAADATVDDPAQLQYKNLCILVNVRKRSDNKLFQSILCKSVRLTGAAAAEPVRDEATIARSGIALNVLRLKGVALEYTRAMKAGSTAFVQSSANSYEDSVAAVVSNYCEWDVANTPTVVSAADTSLDGTALIYLLKNGDPYVPSDSSKPALVDIPTKKIKINKDDFGANDVFEAFTSYVEA